MTKFVILNLIILCNFVNYIYSQSTQSVASDSSLCTCNLTPNSCDINCCCDSDCSSAIKAQFSTCILNSIVTNDRVCSYSGISYDSVTKQQVVTTTTSKNGFCVYTNNYNDAAFYTTVPTITDSAVLNSTISSRLYNLTSDTATVQTPNSTSTIISPYPTGFVLSGNRGYEIGKPIMRAIQNNQMLNIATDSLQWWQVKSGDNCESSSTVEQILFGQNLMAGCSISSQYTCDRLKGLSNLYLTAESSLGIYRIASFANVSLTNLNDWVNITTTNAQLPSGDCQIVTTRTYEIMYSRTGTTQYLHNKIIGVRAQSTYSSVLPVTNSQINLYTVVNFIDVTPQSVISTKLSPFLTIKLPYDFFFPIYTP